MNILALDLSKRSTGWAVWSEGQATARYGSWELGTEFTCDGGVYMALHRRLADLCKVAAVEHVYFEDPLNHTALNGHTNIATLRVLGGLAAHVESFAQAKRFRTVKRINVNSWRGEFIGRIAQADAKARARNARKEGNDRASARGELKALTMQRCRALGFAPRKDDEADALGILDYACTMHGVVPPWRVADAELFGEQAL